MGGRSIAGLVTLALLLPGAVMAGPRHEARWSDPTGSAIAHAWVQEHEGEARLGHGAHVAPRRPQAAPPETPFGQIVPVPTDPDAYAVPSVEGPDLAAGQHLPDLVPLPAWDVYADSSVVGAVAGDYIVDTVQGRDPLGGGKKAIRFGTTIANRGRHSLEVVGLPSPTGDAADPVRVAASQCVRFAGPRLAGGARLCEQYRPVGSLVLHPQHGHFHIDGFAEYRLLKDRGGRPDLSPAGTVVRSEKVGFCMGDTDWLGAGQPVLDTGWYRECRHTAPNVPVTFRQGVSPQWGDSYGSGLPGQHLIVEKVPDGVYWIAISVNPGVSPGAVKLFETTLANNTSFQKIRLSKNGTVAEPV
jgi:hypothetical protein